MENCEYVFRCSNIKKKYGQQYALNGLTMNVKSGEIYGFVGENGSGKTTIIRVITGLIHPTEGEFELFGVKSSDGSGIVEARKNIGAIVETPSIYQGMNLKTNMLLQGMIVEKNDPAKIKEVLELVGLYSIYEDPKKVANFSLGMRQRLGIAMALLKEPKFIILDEPMNGLDPEGVVSMRNLITYLNQERGITFLISSHILTELGLIATSYGIISRGKMVKEISKEEIEKELVPEIVIKVSDPELAYDLLKDKFNVRTNKKKIYISGDAVKKDIFKILVDEGVDILDFEEKHGDIEEYYLTTIKEAHHD